MLIPLVGNAGSASGHGPWAASAEHGLLGLGLLVVAILYVRGRRRRPASDARSDWCFGLGLLAVAGSVLSPLDGLSDQLASAHMVQHLLLVIAAAPLLAWSRPLATVARGAPSSLVRATARWRRRLGVTGRPVALLSRPLVASLLHASVLWIWHAAVLYDAAVRHPPVHALEHATFFVTGLLFWSGVLTVPGARATGPGERILPVFAVAMQSVFLGVLLTFAERPWYASYRLTAPVRGLAPLADQQLAGVIMWVPAGLVYLAAALGLLGLWLTKAELAENSPPTLGPRSPRG